MSLFPQVVFFCFEVVAVSFVILVNGPMKLLQKRSTICQIDYFKAEYCHHQTGGFNCRRCHRMMSLNSTASSPSLILAQTSDSWKAVVLMKTWTMYFDDRPFGFEIDSWLLNEDQLL